MSDLTTTTELILQGRAAGYPIVLRGALRTAQADPKATTNVEELSGCVQVNASLSSLLRRLQDDHGDAGSALQELLGGSGDTTIVVDTLAVGYRSADDKLVQLGLLIEAGSSTWQLTLLYKAGSKHKRDRAPKTPKFNEGFLVGLELLADKTTLGRNFLSGLLGDISFANLGISYASTDFTEIALYDRNTFSSAASLRLRAPALRKRSFSQGLNVTGELLVGGVNLFEKLRDTKDSKDAKDDRKPLAPKRLDVSNPPPEIEDPKAALGEGTPTTWFDVEQTIGPVSIRRVGVSYRDSRVGIKLDGGLSLSALKIELVGLGLSYPLNQLSTDPKKLWQNVQFHLDGATVSMEQGPIAVTGGLIKVDVPKGDAPGKKDVLRLDGTLLIRTPFFNLAALGSYEDLDGQASLFVFAVLHRTLGGPPCFVVTGIALGFGVNRTLTLPSIHQVHDFPLIRAAKDPKYLGKDLDLRKVSEKLSKYIAPKQGNFWLAAGLTFTSFGQVDSVALLSVSFGTQFELGLIGVSTLRVPKEVPGATSITMACVELAFKVAFTLESGLLSLEARLTENSFVLREDFRLRGGAAFYTWFAGEHAGDFVLSVGGYHPKFTPPAHYPRPELVSFSCQIGDAVAVDGSCYFALCPSAIMAGGRLSIVFETKCVRAWFVAHADFLVQWKPLHYDVSIGISVGVALRLELGPIRVHLSLELGASLQLFGPPLGGVARISLWIVTVTITFGEARAKPKPLLWDCREGEDRSFERAFLPATSSGSQPLSLAVASGLLSEEREQGKQSFARDPRRALSRVSAQKLVLSARTVVPATHITFNEGAPVGANRQVLVPRSPKLGVRPMDKKTLFSPVDVQIVRQGESKPDPSLTQAFQCALSEGNAPSALWSAEELDSSKPSDKQLIANALLGLELSPRATGPTGSLAPYELEAISYESVSRDVDWPARLPVDPLPTGRYRTVSESILESTVVSTRTSILNVLRRERDVMDPAELDLTRLSEAATFLFQASPIAARVGQPPLADRP